MLTLAAPGSTSQVLASRLGSVNTDASKPDSRKVRGTAGYRLHDLSFGGGDGQVWLFHRDVPASRTSQSGLQATS
jgi:hypothetical protein